MLQLFPLGFEILFENTLCLFSCLVIDKMFSELTSNKVQIDRTNEEGKPHVKGPCSKWDPLNLTRWSFIHVEIRFHLVKDLNLWTYATSSRMEINTHPRRPRKLMENVKTWHKVLRVDIKLAEVLKIRPTGLEPISHLL